MPCTAVTRPYMKCPGMPARPVSRCWKLTTCDIRACRPGARRAGANGAPGLGRILGASRLKKSKAVKRRETCPCKKEGTIRKEVNKTGLQSQMHKKDTKF